ncbi:DUF2268 domain-containing protein [Solibacillus sp. CAU 1738]|uniref:DUF2268 domain-containing protein n=1 Tax=Solibacillus sp. CAU 1738 TaxID=3140363 RepID=UPI0032611C3A
MPVLKTEDWLLQLLDCKTDVIRAHSECICAPLIPYFQNATSGEIQFELLRQGLFKPEEIQHSKQLLSTTVWQTVQQEFERLRLLWNGPDVAVVILPITKEGPQKNGVAYRRTLVLFVSALIEEKELKALLAHEYNHVCRLAFLQQRPDQITLLNSLIIEGLAEHAVEQLYGEEFLSPWTKSYTIEEIIPIWKQYIMPNLQLKGVSNHREFLYGNSKMPWIGYCIGYRIVQSFAAQQSDLTTLLTTPAQEILANSQIGI